MDDDETKDPTEEGSKEPEPKPEGAGEDKKEGLDVLSLLGTPEGLRAVDARVEALLASRDEAKKDAEEAESLLQAPDDEVGRRTKEALVRQREKVELMPEVQRDFYAGVVADLIRTVPELAELTPEERQAVLSPNLRTDADVLKALTNIVGEKRAAKVVAAATEKAIETYKQGKALGAIAKGNEDIAPGLEGGKPVGAATGETDPSKLLSEWFTENPLAID
jgi:hypothetical protein